MSWIMIGLIAIVVFAVLIIKLAQGKSNDDVDYPYRELDALFTPAERSFLGVLLQAVEKDVQVFGKVRVADVIGTRKGLSASDRQRAFNKISSKHFDFILCSKKDLSFLCAIELNDKSHNSKRRKDRDRFLEGACKSAGISLVQIPAKATYNISDIRQSFLPFLQPSIGVSLPAKSKAIVDEQLSDKKTCQKCSSVMVKRTAKKGKNIGSEFWACSSYPKCKYLEPISG